MTAKNVLNKIMTLLTSDEVNFTDAKSANGDILQSPTFDLNETVDIVHEDGTKTPAPDGEYTISLKDESGNENIIRIEVKDGKIVERANEEEEKNEEEMADEKTKPVTEEYQPAESDVRKDAEGTIEKGTLKAAEQTDEAETIPQDDEKPMEEEGEKPVDLAKTCMELSYRIQEMEAKFAKLEAMFPPVDSEVTNEEEGIKMSAETEEELPKLDGAPVDEANGLKFSAEQNNKNYGKKAKDSQSNFLAKLYK